MKGTSDTLERVDILYPLLVATSFILSLSMESPFTHFSQILTAIHSGQVMQICIIIND
jgi:hypothetical protein